MGRTINIKLIVKDILDRYPILEDDRIKLTDILVKAYNTANGSANINANAIKKLIYNEIYGFDIKPEGVVVATTKDLINKVDKVEGKQLSTEDFTRNDKIKLDSLVNYDDAEIQRVLNQILNKLQQSDYISVVGTENEDIKLPTLNGKTVSLITDAKSIIIGDGTLIDYINQLEEDNTAYVERIDELEKKNEFYEGHNNVTSLSNIPVTKRLVKASIATSQGFSISKNIGDGKELHIIVNNSNTEEITIALPNTGYYVCLVDTALTIEPGAFVEINVISDGGLMYIRSI